MHTDHLENEDPRTTEEKQGNQNKDRKGKRWRKADAALSMGQPGSSELCTFRLATQGPAWTPRVSLVGHPDPQSPQPLPKVMLPLRGDPSSPPSWFGPHLGGSGRKHTIGGRKCHIGTRKSTLESMWAKGGNNQMWNVGLLYDDTPSGLKNTIWRMGEVAHTFNARIRKAEASGSLSSKPAWFT